MKPLDAGEGGSRRDAVDQNKAFAVSNPLVPQCRVFFLAGGVEDFKHAGLAVDDNLLSVGIFDRWIILPGAKRVRMWVLAAVEEAREWSRP